MGTQFWNCFSQKVLLLSWYLLFSCSVVTVCNPMDCSMPGFPILHHLPEFAQTHVHCMESVMPSKHLVLCHTLLSSCIQSFLASESFPMSWLFASGGQNIGASASSLPMNNQGWFPLELTGLISLQSKGLSRGFSSTIIWKQQFFSAQHLTLITF